MPIHKYDRAISTGNVCCLFYGIMLLVTGPQEVPEINLFLLPFSDTVIQRFLSFSKLLYNQFDFDIQT